MKRKLLIIGFLVLLSAISFVSGIGAKILYDKYLIPSKYQKTKEAWKNSDSVYIKKYIENLQNLNHFEFVCATVNLSEITDFGYGLYDTDDYRERIISKEDLMSRYNVTQVWLAYIDSPLFMKKIKTERGINFQQCFYIRDRWITANDIDSCKKLMIEIDKPGESCGESYDE